MKVNYNSKKKYTSIVRKLNNLNEINHLENPKLNYVIINNINQHSTIIFHLFHHIIHIICI